MRMKNSMEIFLENVPMLKSKAGLLLTMLYHFIIFLGLISFFWYIINLCLFAILPLQLFCASIANIPFIYLARNFDKIRECYLKKYHKNPWQRFWYRYSYTSPFGAAALYSPLLLCTYTYLPRNYAGFDYMIFAEHEFLAPIVSLFFLVFGILVLIQSKNLDRDLDIYLFIMDPSVNPDEIKINKGGIYKFIRHPRFLSRLIISLGIGIASNNLIGLAMAFLHFIPYYICMREEDKSLFPRGISKSVEIYQRNVPALIPKGKNFFRFIMECVRIRRRKGFC